MSYQQRQIGTLELARAFAISHDWLKKEIQLRMVPDNLITKEQANDTVAALLQARDLSLAIYKAGYTFEQMHRWIEMLIAADEEERAKLQELVTT